MNSTMASSEDHKAKGNKLFANKDYSGAIREYTNAIIKNPYNAVYFTNRALCHLKLEKFDKVIADTEKAIELDEKSVKAYYLLGQALTKTGYRLTEAVSMLKKAYDLGSKQKVGYIEDILTALRNAKKARWQRDDEKRRKEQNDLYGYLTRLVERDRERQLSQLSQHNDGDNNNNNDDDDTIESKATINYEHDNRISQIQTLFGQADENQKKRDVPDYLCGKISFEIMTDPVITPNGITYDRPEIIQHLTKLGKNDPITRTPLHENDLIPNFAMKEVIDSFVSVNGWAVDY